MPKHFTHPAWLLLAQRRRLVGVVDADVGCPGRALATLEAPATRLLIMLALLLALAGIRWLKPIEGMNLFFSTGPPESPPANRRKGVNT
jgi:hypothetical protein